MTLAVDMSKWSGAFTDAEAACMVAAGYRRTIVGVSKPMIARQQMAMCRKHGMDVQAYCYLYWDTPTEYVRRAIDSCGDLFSVLWLDVEQEPGPGSAQAGAAVAKAEAYCLSYNKLPGIYTSSSKWRAIMGNSTAFRHLPLWNAYYDNDPDFDFGRFPYGGWSRAAMEQFGNTQLVCGQSVDVNVYEEGRMYSDKEVDAKVAAVLSALIETNRKVDAQAALLEVLIPPLVTGTAGEARARYIWVLAGKPWPA